MHRLQPNHIQHKQSGSATSRFPLGRPDATAPWTCLPGVRGIIVFAHGSGSSRFSLRHRYVAGVLHDAGLGTLLMDLLTPEEEEVVDAQTRERRFAIALLATRRVDTTVWIAHTRKLRHVRIGYFGARTGGGAALIAAARLAHVIGAVVSRGGRPDLAGAALSQVGSATLLLVGGRDTTVIHLNAFLCSPWPASHWSAYTWYASCSFLVSAVSPSASTVPLQPPSVASPLLAWRAGPLGIRRGLPRLPPRRTSQVAAALQARHRPSITGG